MMDIDKSRLGHAVRDIRLKLGMTQRELADESSLSVNYLSLLENGKRGIGLDQLNKLAGIFGVPALLILALASDMCDETDHEAGNLLKQIQLVTRQAINLYCRC